MMLVESQIQAWLKNNAALAALIQSGPWSGPLPQGVPLPTVAFQRISATRTYSMTGYSALVNSRFQFTVLAEDQLDALNVKQALIAAIHSFGNSGRAAFVVGERDMYDPATQNRYPMVDVTLIYPDI